MYYQHDTVEVQVFTIVSLTDMFIYMMLFVDFPFVYDNNKKKL